VKVIYPAHAPAKGRVSHPVIRSLMYGFVLAMLGILAVTCSAASEEG